MGHHFETQDDLDLTATPEQVWDAIATGPGMDAWFLGHNDVVPGVGGSVQCDFGGGAMPAQQITTWEPGHRLRTTTGEVPSGRFLASEYLIAARGPGSTSLRIVTSGFLPGDDWETEFEAMQAGGCAFRSTLAEYLAHFAGQKAHPITVFGPSVADWPAAWTAFDDSLGLHGLDRGQKVSIEEIGITGELFAANEQTRSIRSDDAIYRFLQGFGGSIVLCHILFGDQDAARETARWQSWADRSF